MVRDRTNKITCFRLYQSFSISQVVQLGVLLQPLQHNRMNISLIYTDLTKFASSQIIASFVAPYMMNKFIQFALQVTQDTITLLLNCQKYEILSMIRHPEELVFDPASTLYIGQAGPLIKGNFEVSFFFF